MREIECYQHRRQWRCRRYIDRSRHILLPDQLLHVGLAQLLVVKEGGVGVNVGVEALLDNLALGVNLDASIVMKPKS